MADEPATAAPVIRSPFGPICLWLLIQMTALAISTTRVPFYAAKSFPEPAEILAAGVMLTFQIGAAAMLFPYLLRDWRATGLVVIASWPFMILAQILTSEPGFRTYLTAAPFVAVWLVGLALWRSILRSPRWLAAAATVATLITFGGPLLYYFRSEYRTGMTTYLPGSWGPLCGALTVSARDPVHRGAWFFAALHLAVAVMAYGIAKLVAWRAAR